MTEVPQTMRAVAFNQFGGIETLQLQTVPVPAVGSDEVLIRVEVAGVGSWDAEERRGEYEGAFGLQSTFPYILGWDGAGEVVAVGEQVKRFSQGDWVYAASMPLPKGGFYAEYAVVGEEFVSEIPSTLPIEQAGAMPWDALTALSGLKELRLNSGETVMILGAGGGIGHLAVQLAKLLGYRVFAVASGDDGVALAKQLGADAAVDGRAVDAVAAARAFAPDGLDAALVTFGGAAAEQTLIALRDGAMVACPHGVNPVPTVGSGVHLKLYNGERSPEATDRLNHLIEVGPFKVHVARTFSLEQATDAHEQLETHFVGKLSLALIDAVQQTQHPSDMKKP